MELNPLFKNQFHILKLYGVQLYYENDYKSTLRKYLAIYSFISVCTAQSLVIFNAIFEEYSVLDFSEMLCSYLPTTACLIKLIAFWTRRKKFKILMETLMKMWDSTESTESLNRISRLGNILSKLYLINANLTSTFYVLGALYQNIFYSPRVFIYKMR